jgi:hypothetical protein
MSEVCSVVDTSQFEPGKSVDACGFYSVSLLHHAGRPGQAPTGNASDVAAWADAEYTAYDGPDVFANNNGMTMGILFNVLGDAGLHYQVIGSTEIGLHTEHLTADYVRAWLKLGYPVVLAVAEDNVFDLDLGDKPYAWDTSGFYHVITATGIDGSALLCHDTASIAPDGVRAGPRRYDAARLQAGMISATAVVMPWLDRPADGFDPMTQGDTMFHYLTLAEQAAWFKETTAGKDDEWTCLKNDIVLGGDHLQYFRHNGGVAQFGLPLSAETPLDAKSHPEVTAVKYERGVNFYDPNHIFDNPPLEAGQPVKTVYRAHIDSGQGLHLLVGTPIVQPTINVPGAISAALTISTAVTSLKVSLGVQ